MVSVDTIYTLIQFIINKNQSGYLSPTDFDKCINEAQREYVAYLLGDFQQYTPGRPISRVELGNNQTVRQRLSPTIYGYNLPIDITGFSPYPGDYIQTDAMWSFYGFNRIRYVQQDSLFSYYNSVIDPIATNPIYLIEDTGFRFYPAGIGAAKMIYVKNPTRIHWGYTLDVNDRPVYDESTSEQPIWDETAIWDIVVRALRIVGVNLQAADVNQYVNEIKGGGQ